MNLTIPKIFFTSDTHYNHKNIVSGCSTWGERGPDSSIHSKQNTRKFDTLEKHNEAIVAGINNIVGENDILYHLGDWSFGGYEFIPKFRERIICKNIHLRYGNHDEHIEKNKIIADKPSQDLFSSTNHIFWGNIASQEFYLSHYAHRVWPRSHKGTIHLYGHSHDTLEKHPYGKSMDVGVDAAFRLFGEYRPFSWYEVMAIMNKREILIVDHHNKYTS